MAGKGKSKAKPRAKKTYRRKAPIRRAPIDGQNILVNAYFEAKQALVAGESVMSYAICIDPKSPLVTKLGTLTLHDGGDANAQLGGASNNEMVLPKWTTFSGLFNQYRINGATIKVRVDGECGLENAVITCNDKGNESAITNMRQALTGAHKSHSMTVSRRELSYGVKSSGQDLDFYSTNDNVGIVSREKRYIKVFQKLPPNTAAAGEPAKVCEHQVQVLLSLTLKDSKNLN